MTLRLLYGCRLLGPVLFGFTVGSFLCLISFPLFRSVFPNENYPLNEDCDKAIEGSRLSRHMRSVDRNLKAVIDLPKNDNAYSTLAMSAACRGSLMNSSETTKRSITVNRPRFAATELGLKEKLFVGIISSRQSVHSLAITLNRTMSHHLPKVVFFVEGSESEKLPGQLNLVGFHEVDQWMLPLHMIDYIGKNIISDYEWFFIAPDHAYVKAFKLYELVSHLSLGTDLWLGHRLHDDPRLCDFEAGFIINARVMKQLFDSFSLCQSAVATITRDNVQSTHGANDIFRICLQQAGLHQLNCKEEWDGKLFRHWRTDLIGRQSGYLDNGEVGRLSTEHEYFDASITVSPVKSPQEMLNLHSHFARSEGEQVLNVLSTIERTELVEAAHLFPSDYRWPFGASTDSKPLNRHEINKWDYFTDRDVFYGERSQNKGPLIGPYAQDLHRWISESKTWFLNHSVTVGGGGGSDSSTKMQFRTGYRRFDPHRGLEYVLDFDLVMSPSRKPIKKRLHIVRPVSRVEISPMPYVTEATTVTVVIPVDSDEVDDAIAFLKTYSTRFISSSVDNIQLIFALSYTSRSQQNKFASLLQDISTIKEQFQSNGLSTKDLIHLDYWNVRAGTKEHILLMKEIIAQFGSDKLYLFGLPQMDLRAEFLNRVRMNTIQGAQVFFPIPFMQYDPTLLAKAIVYDGKRNKVQQQKLATGQLEVHKHQGHFDALNYEVASFYGSDFLNCVETYDSLRPADHVPRLDLSAVFTEYAGLSVGRSTVRSVTPAILHLIRAVEPALKIFFCDTHRSCAPNLASSDYERCIKSHKMGLASKPQLASLVVEGLHFGDDIQTPANSSRPSDRARRR